MTPPDGVDPEVWRAGLERARETLAQARPARQCGGHKLCKQPVTDLSGLCPRHLAKAMERAAEVNAVHGAPQ
jgi:hypothetical protein